jgi:hypothetical protein
MSDAVVLLHSKSVIVGEAIERDTHDDEASTWDYANRIKTLKGFLASIVSSAFSSLYEDHNDIPLHSWSSGDS